jgi:hypothetical protein
MSMVMKDIIKKQVIANDLKEVFKETKVFLITNVLVSLLFVSILLIIDIEYLKLQILRTTLFSLELIISFLFIILQFIIFFVMVLKKYSHNRKPIESLLKEEESNTLEFKSSIRWDYNLEKVNKDLMHSILKTIAGFSNSDGGTLLIGVSDDKKVLGLEKDFDTLKRKDKDGFIQYLTQMILNNLGINIMRNISVNIKTLSGKDICQIEVLPANEPVFLSYSGKDEFFIRTANMTIPLTIKESYVYLQRRN